MLESVLASKLQLLALIKKQCHLILAIVSTNSQKQRLFALKMHSYTVALQACDTDQLLGMGGRSCWVVPQRH